MKKIYIHTLVIVATLFLLSCTKSVVRMYPPTSRVAAATPTKVRLTNNFIFGLVGIDKSDAIEICGGENKLIKIKKGMTLKTHLIRIFTIGLYTPMQIEYYCND